MLRIMDKITDKPQWDVKVGVHTMVFFFIFLSLVWFWDANPSKRYLTRTL